MYSEIQPSPCSELTEYESRIIVAGSRGFSDYDLFSEQLEAYLEKKHNDKTFIFISGRARTGADDLIIQWCQQEGHPWVEVAARWDELGKRAGYVRNAEMGEMGTHLLCYWDGISRGTAHMIDVALRLKLPTQIVTIDPPIKDHHGWKP